VQRVAKSRLSKQKTLREPYTWRMVCPEEAKIKGKPRETGERTMFLAKT